MSLRSRYRPIEGLLELIHILSCALFLQELSQLRKTELQNSRSFNDFQGRRVGTKCKIIFT